MRALILLALVIPLSGCALYPSFDAAIVNRTDEAIEVRLTVYRAGSQVFQAEQTVRPHETWDVGVFARREGDYRIVVESNGAVVAQENRTFGHDEGPGGVTVRFAPGVPPEMTYWYN